MGEKWEFELWRCRRDHLRIVLPGFTPMGCGAFMGRRYCNEPMRRKEHWAVIRNDTSTLAAGDTVEREGE